MWERLVFVPIGCPISTAERPFGFPGGEGAEPTKDCRAWETHTSIQQTADTANVAMLIHNALCSTPPPLPCRGYVLER